MNRVAALAQATFVCFFLQSCSFASEMPVSSEASSEIQGRIVSILECGHNRTDECRQEMETLRDQSAKASVKNLAIMVLEEWDLPAEHKLLKSPRLAWEPKRKYPEGLELPKWSFTVVRGEVGMNGRVRDAEILRSSGSDDVDRICLNGFLDAVFRPAIKDGDYVTAISATSCEVKLE